MLMPMYGESEGDLLTLAPAAWKPETEHLIKAKSKVTMIKGGAEAQLRLILAQKSGMVPLHPNTFMVNAARQLLPITL